MMQNTHPTLESQAARKSARVQGLHAAAAQATEGVADAGTNGVVAQEVGREAGPERKPERTLASGLTHDLNNTFATLLMSIEMLKAKCSAPELLELVEIVEASARRGLATAHQVVSLSQAATAGHATDVHAHTQPPLPRPATTYPTGAEP